MTISLKKFLCLSFLLFLFFLSICLSSQEMEMEEYPNPRTLADLKALLFPNQTHLSMLRRLDIVKKPVTGKEPCTTCQGLSTCVALNGFMVQEVYYPKNPALRETCTVLDSLGARVQSSIFGVGRTFRDDKQCRSKISQFFFLLRLTIFAPLSFSHGHAIFMLILGFEQSNVY